MSKYDIVAWLTLAILICIGIAIEVIFSWMKFRLDHWLWG